MAGGAAEEPESKKLSCFVDKDELTVSTAKGSEVSHIVIVPVLYVFTYHRRSRACLVDHACQ